MGDDAAEKLIVGEYRPKPPRRARPRRAKFSWRLPYPWPYPVALLLIDVLAYWAAFYWPMPQLTVMLGSELRAGVAAFGLLLPFGMGLWWVADWLAKRD